MIHKTAIIDSKAKISEKFDVNFNKEKAINNAFVIAFKELTSSVITTKDEKKIHKSLTDYRLCGEWFSIDALDNIKNIINLENQYANCSREAAIKTRRRL